MTAFLLSLREGLEAALLVGILLGSLRRFGRQELGRFVWFGIGAALLVSVTVAGGLVAAGAQFEGRAEEIFEGVTLLLAAGFLTGMIFWMKGQGRRFQATLASDVRKAAALADDARGAWGLFAVAFLAVVREGVELALLLVATTLAGDASSVLSGAALGIGAAIVIGVLLYRGVLVLNLGAFFRVTNVALLFFAAGMVALGCHELIEASLMPAVIDPIYNVNAALSDKSTLGEVLKSLLGYNGNPALTESAAYVAYLAVVGWLTLGQSPTRRPQPAAA